MLDSATTGTFTLWSDKKKVQVEIKFVKCIIFLCFKFFSLKLISFFSNDHFNNNIAILESKVIYIFARGLICNLQEKRLFFMKKM